MENKIIIIYLIGLVIFTTISYLALDRNKDLSIKQRNNLGIYSFLWGALWPLFLVIWYVQATKNRRK